MGLLPRRRAPARAEESGDAEGRAGTYRVEVDTEPHHFPAHGVFSFWSAVKSIFVLSLLLWWLPQNLGAMIAGYVGGRRSGSHWKAVIAALVPVFVLYAGQWLGEHRIGVAQLEFLASLPSTLAAAIATAIPPAQPYIEFLWAYFATFVLALRATFGMQANGYLIVVVFAYIGGIVGEQIRREMGEEVPSTSISIVQPVVERLRAAVREDHPRKAPAVRVANLVPVPVGLRPREATRARPRGEPARFTDFHPLAAVLEKLPRAHDARTVRVERHETESHPALPVDPRRHEHERDLVMQRFVERALAEYGHSHKRPH